MCLSFCLKLRPVFLGDILTSGSRKVELGAGVVCMQPGQCT